MSQVLRHYLCLNYFFLGLCVLSLIGCESRESKNKRKRVEALIVDISNIEMDILTESFAIHMEHTGENLGIIPNESKIAAHQKRISELMNVVHQKARDIRLIGYPRELLKKHFGLNIAHYGLCDLVKDPSDVIGGGYGLCMSCSYCAGCKKLLGSR